MKSLRLNAPAKINWTLEVLGKRPDGYREIRSIMQTIALADLITLTADDEITLSITGDAGTLTSEPVEQNLAYRAAALLCGSSKRGVRVELEKHIPIAAGLGGGSSDAAAVLRGLRRLWELDLPDEELAASAAELGSDVPFFLHGGTAIASGRGEQIEPLPDVAEQTLVVAWETAAQTPDKTARMYAALRPEDYTDGLKSKRLADLIRHGETVRGEDICNVFERMSPNLGRLTAVGRPHLCGSGPAVFFLPSVSSGTLSLLEELRTLGLQAIETQTTGMIVDR